MTEQLPLSLTMCGHALSGFQSKCREKITNKVKIRASLVAQMIKNLPAMLETRVQSLGQEDPLEKGMATHSSTLAWGIPLRGGAWRATPVEQRCKCAGPSPCRNTGFWASQKAWTWLLKDTRLCSSKWDCSRPCPEPEHAAGMGVHRANQESKRAPRERRRMKAVRKTGCTGPGTQGQRVCVNRCRLLRRQAVMTEEGPENPFWERCAEELEREEMGG